jgi:hypothetical protein
MEMGQLEESEEHSTTKGRRKFLSQIARLTAVVGLGRYWPTRALAQSGRMVAPGSTAAFSGLSAELVAEWLNPPRSYRPHTRWWWPGNAVTRDGIAWELEQMRQQGMGGVEIMSPWRMYTRGNIPYLSPEFVDIVKYTIQEAERLDMDVAISFSARDGSSAASGFLLRSAARC